MKKIILAITGASGSIYAYRFIKHIQKNKNIEIALIFSKNGKKVWNYELKNPKIPPEIKIYDNDNFFVPFASGTSEYSAMAIIPCSMGTLAKIANGISDTLITRSADVMLKENKQLILLPRETPYNLIHLENMKKIILNGGKIVPASPAFYSHPKNINELIDSVLQKIFNLMKIKKELIKWQP